jgi:hypothetical protein
MKLIVWFFLLATLAIPAYSQDVLVTFYSPGSLAKTLLKAMVTLKGSSPFVGSIFDGDHRLAELQANHFATFRLPAGLHKFSASYSNKHPGKVPDLTIFLNSNEHYCIRASAEYKSTTVLLGGLGYQNSFLEQIPCDAAIKESPSAEATKEKHIDKGAQSIFVNSATIEADNSGKMSNEH